MYIGGFPITILKYLSQVHSQSCSSIVGLRELQSASSLKRSMSMQKERNARKNLTYSIEQTGFKLSSLLLRSVMHTTV